MFRIGFAYKHVRCVDAFIFVTCITETDDAYILDVSHWTRPSGWPPCNLGVYEQITILKKDSDQWTNFIMGDKRCLFQPHLDLNTLARSS
jgi:hypothetical protein